MGLSEFKTKHLPGTAFVLFLWGVIILGFWIIIKSSGDKPKKVIEDPLPEFASNYFQKLESSTIKLAALSDREAYALKLQFACGGENHDDLSSWVVKIVPTRNDRYTIRIEFYYSDQEAADIMHDFALSDAKYAVKQCLKYSTVGSLWEGAPEVNENQFDIEVVQLVNPNFYYFNMRDPEFGH